MYRFRWAAFLVVYDTGHGWPDLFSTTERTTAGEVRTFNSRINDLQEAYENTARELTDVHDENRKLSQELDEAWVKIETMEQRKNKLESILLNQRQTYQNAVAMRGATMSVLTRSNFTAETV